MPRRKIRVRLRTPPIPIGRAGAVDFPRSEQRDLWDLLTEISSRFVNLPASEIEQQVDSGLQMIGEFLDIDQCYFNQFSDGGARFRATHAWARDGVDPEFSTLGLDLEDDFPWCTEKMRVGETLLLNKLDDFPPSAVNERRYWQGLRIQSGLCIPLMVGGEVWGSVEFFSIRKRQTWTDQIIRRLRVLGEIFGNALVRGRRERELESRLRFEEFLTEISRMFVNLPVHEVEKEIGRALERLGRLMGVDRVVFLQLSEDHTELRVTHVQPLEGIAPDPGLLFVRVEERFDWLTCKLATGEQVRISSLDELPPEAGAELEYCREIGIKSFVMAPLTVAGEFKGAIGFDMLREERIWSDEISRRLRIVGELFTNALERKRNEDALRQSHGRYQRLLESTKAIPWVLDARTWRFTYIGPQVEKLFGYPPEQWLESGFWVDHIHPDDQEYAVEFCRQSSERLEAHEFEYRLLKPDGTAVWIQDIVSVEQKDGRPDKLRGFMIDISDRKRADEALAASEAQLRLVADAFPALISYIDTEQRYRFVNKEYERAYKTSKEELLGRTMREVNGDEKYERFRPYVEQALAGNKLSFEGSTPLPGGEVEHFHSTYVPHINREGHILGVYLLCQNITDRIRSEEKLREHQVQLTHVSRVAMMGELATGLAHEINQPLCAIISNAQSSQRLLMEEMFGRQEIREVLSDIIADGKRASEVIQKLRVLLKGGELEHQPLNLNEICREVVALVQRDASIRHVNLSLDLAASLPATRGDRIHLQQVLINLIVNAFDAMDSSERSKRNLMLQTSMEDPDAVKVSVIDAGSGIQGDAATKIFEPFFTTKSAGLGMGLSISRTIVEMHDGKLWATSNPLGGATFHIKLPRLAEESPVETEDSAVEEAEPAVPPAENSGTL
ncbi:MAG: PAS domain S-box protein [Acidobacteriota bacterium]